MPHGEAILGLPDYQIKEIRRRNGQVELWARHAGPIACPDCGSRRLRKKDRYERHVRHESYGLFTSVIHLEGVKHQCLSCGRYFNQRFPGILPRKRSSEPLRREVFCYHMDGVCRTKLAERQRLGTATVERWFKDLLKREAAKLSGEPCPSVLGIDEHFFTRKKGFATTFCDLKNHKVYDVVLGRSEADLDGYFQALEGKDRVRVVCIDLSSSYRALVRKHFPNARIIADRFHVVRLVNQYFLAAWKQLDDRGSKNRGLRSLIRRHPHNLKPDQQVRLQAYLDEHPAIATIYAFKQDLIKLQLQKTQKALACKRLIPQLLDAIHQLKTCGLDILQQLGRTLGSWSGEIAAMWRFSRNNGITEGFHNKMEMTSRRAFGFRNLDNYRLQVRVMCA